MACSRKRSTPSDSAGSSKLPKRQVRNETFRKWQRAYEKDHQSMVWLRADLDTKDKCLVSTLWCVVCRKYENQLSGHKNFSSILMDGSTDKGRIENELFCHSVL